MEDPQKEPAEDPTAAQNDHDKEELELPALPPHAVDRRVALPWAEIEPAERVWRAGNRVVDALGLEGHGGKLKVQVPQ